MNIKQLTLAALAVTTGAAMAAMPEVSNVTMTQAANRLVTITYQLTDAPAVVTLDIQTNANTSAAANDPGWTSIGGVAVCNAQGDVWKQVSGKATYTITWQPDQSWKGPDENGFKIAANGARARVTAWPLDNTPDYMAVDVSAAAQPNTQTYYPAADFVPGGVTNSIYKTTKLLMRKIMAKGVEWTMGSAKTEVGRNSTREETHQVTLSNNYYIGVYEVTQTQWGEVATNSTVSASFAAERTMRPMEKVCYNEIRLKCNSSAAATADEIANYSWPKNPNPSSFLGLLRSKTGLDFDLPSEAQWEFAARGGYGSGYWNNGTAILDSTEDENLKSLGRYLGNNPGGGTEDSSLAPSAGGTAIVGSFAPSDWGLYDMHGNVWEWCLDWCENDISEINGKTNIDPVSPAKPLSDANVTGSNRVARGGAWNGKAQYSRPAGRNPISPTYRGAFNGFRVVCQGGLQ